MFIAKSKNTFKQINQIFCRTIGYRNVNLPKTTFLFNNIYTKTLNQKMKTFFSKRKIVRDEKQDPKIQKIQHQSKDESQFMWKLNILFNAIGIGAGVYFPAQSLIFVLLSNSMIQIYLAGKQLDRIKQIGEKSQVLSTEQINGSIKEVRSILKKVMINKGALFISTILMCTGIFYPTFLDYSLIGLNFWILSNIKFNNFAQGFYLALLSLLLFQYLYFNHWFMAPQSDRKIVL